MATQWCDDFTAYGSTVGYMLNGPYAQTDNAALILDPDVNAPVQRVLQHNGGGGGSFTRKVLTAAVTTAGMAFRLYPAALPSSGETDVCSFGDSGNTTNVLITMTSTGALKAWRGERSLLLGTTTGPVVVANAWTHIEVKVLFSETVGTVEIRVNGVVVLNGTNLDTVQNAIVSCSQVSLRMTPLTPNFSFKDFIVWDGTGAVNNNFFGSCTVSAMLPDGDDTNTWARSSGAVSNTLINESDPNDTNYISDAFPAAAKQVNTLSNLPTNVTAVKALMTFTRAANSDGGTGNMKTGLVSGATSGLGADKPLTSAFTYYNDFFEVDPNTAAAWTVANANAAKISFTRTA
jgi:hypothetical protein